MDGSHTTGRTVDNGPDGRDRNEVWLSGRVTSPPERRILPSGDEVVALRVTVRRDDGGSDTLRITVGPAPASGRRRKPGQLGRRALTTAEGFAVGSRITLSGELRRRWWDGGGARRSLVEVRATAIDAA